MRLPLVIATSLFVMAGDAGRSAGDFIKFIGISIRDSTEFSDWLSSSRVKSFDLDFIIVSSDGAQSPPQVISVDPGRMGSKNFDASARLDGAGTSMAQVCFAFGTETLATTPGLSDFELQIDCPRIDGLMVLGSGHVVLTLTVLPQDKSKLQWLAEIDAATDGAESALDILTIERRIEQQFNRSQFEFELLGPFVALLQRANARSQRLENQHFFDLRPAAEGARMSVGQRLYSEVAALAAEPDGRRRVYDAFSAYRRVNVPAYSWTPESDFTRVYFGTLRTIALLYAEHAGFDEDPTKVILNFAETCSGYFDPAITSPCWKAYDALLSDFYEIRGVKAEVPIPAAQMIDLFKSMTMATERLDTASPVGILFDLSILKIIGAECGELRQPLCGSTEYSTLLARYELLAPEPQPEDSPDE